MKKFIKIVLFCIGLLILCELIIGYCDKKIHGEAYYEGKEYDWNKGRCVYDGAKLEYIKTGNKEHYICPTCNREFTFDSVGSYK